MSEANDKLLKPTKKPSKIFASVRDVAIKKVSATVFALS